MQAFVERKNLQHCHHTLTDDESSTVDAIVACDPNCDILVTPNHHFDADGVFGGFRVCFPQHTTGVQLPINRNIFFGHTIAEASSCVGVNQDIIALVSDPDACRERMQELLREIDEESRGHEASLGCMPQNVEVLQKGDSCSGVRDQRAVDCKPWRPEPPLYIGIYHTYTRGYNKDTREHRLYIACGGGCTLASEAYYNLLLDLGPDTDVDEIVDSEETWWLRQTSTRARCRLLHRLAQKFNINVPTITDLHSYDSVPMVRHTTDTVINDITRMRSGHVAVFNNAVDTTTSRNGIINSMHPTEGLWVFKGPARSSHGMSSLGSGWGDQRRCGVFPAGTFKVNRERGARERRNPRRECTTVVSRTTDAVVCYKCNHRGTANEYLWYDEGFMRTLEGMGYDRNCGMLELMPIIVGITDW